MDVIKLVVLVICVGGREERGKKERVGSVRQTRFWCSHVSKEEWNGILNASNNVNDGGVLNRSGMEY